MRRVSSNRIGFASAANGGGVAMALALLLLCGAEAARAQDAPEDVATEAASSEAPETKPEADAEAGSTTELNLLGRTNTDAGESRRNENVQFNLIDNNALKELMERMGAAVTIVSEFRADHGYFGAEFGQPPATPIHLRPAAVRPLHGSVYYAHNNSVFSARSFFQVGDVKPARENSYGFTIGFRPWRGAFLSADGNQRKIRGSVNGNVLVPMPDERTPLTNDPVPRPIVQRYLDGYPNELPNRTDINPRMLNTNAPQNINDDAVGVRLDQNAGAKDLLSLNYRLTLQAVDAFQFVAGQNPDTTTRAHEAGLTWRRSWSPTTVASFSARFDRVGSLLVPEENSPETLISIGGALSGLGPGPDIPIDRAENRFRYAGEFSHVWENHTLYAGGELTRQQLNGYESSDHLGLLIFTNEFGRETIDNFRWGVPSWLYGAVGDIHRGYRCWHTTLYAGDQWRAGRQLTLNFGIRHEAITRPVEVDGWDQLPYSSDWNNVGPQFGFAYALPGSFGILRGAYGMHYGQIFPVTFSQMRYNPPHNTMFQFRLPDLHLPVAELMRQGAASRVPPRLTVIRPELETPYSHQYNFSWEAVPTKYLGFQMGYVGSRSHKLLSMWFLNRAQPVQGVPQTFATIQQRRPNPAEGEHRTILNGSRSYFDAVRFTATLRAWKGISAEASYWLSKALSLGPDHLNTAAGTDGYSYWSPSQSAIHAEMKGPTSFDQPHAFLLRGTVEAPRLDGAPGWLRRLFADWNLGTVVLSKSGTPFAVRTGSDSPGFGNVDGSGGDRPNLVDPSVLGRTIGHPDTSRQLLPRSAFAYIQPTDPRGNLGWNTFRKGGIANLNASLWRSFAVGSDHRIEFRMESINLTNTPQFAEPGATLTNPEFGYITNTLNDGRTFRFHVRLEL